MNADLILISIRGALHVGNQARVAYVNSTKRRALVLPLPNFDPSPDFGAAVDFFDESHYDEPPQLVGLIEKIRLNAPFTVQEEQQLIEYHSDELARLLFRNKDHVDLADGTSVGQDAVNALVTITQWRRGADPNPSVLQSIAGSLLEVGIDYFLQVPDSLDENSRQGRALRSFFTALDGISFAEAPVRELPRKLMMSVLESINAHPDLLCANSDYQEVISAATRSLVTDVGKRLVGMENDLTGTQRIESWGEMVFRSLLSGAGALTMSDVGKYLGVDNAGRQALVERTGLAILGMVDEAPVGQLETVFSGANLEELADTVLLVLAENPDLVTNNNSRLRPLISRAAADIAAIDALEQKGLIPEIVRLVVVATGENAHLIWPSDDDDPAHNLALTAVKTVISTITQTPPTGSTWKARLSDRDITDISEMVLSELASNPGWLINELSGDDGRLKTILEATFRVLRDRGGKILSKDTGLQILSQSIQAVATRSEFSEKMPDGRVLIAAVTDAVLGGVLDSTKQKALWQLARQETLESLLQTTLDEIAELDIELDQSTGIVNSLEQVLQDHVARLQAGGAWNPEAFAQDLSTAFIGGN